MLRITLRELFDLAGELNQEDQRADAEEFSEEELAVFDLLTQHEPHLTIPERNEVKGCCKGIA